MEPASLGLLFGCLGAIFVFCGSKYYMQRRWGTGPGSEKRKSMMGDAAPNDIIETSYKRLVLLRVITLLLSLTAVGLWFLEPKPYAAGTMASLACFCLWRGWLLRGKILKRLQEKRNVDS